ncbi:SDR family NAD(P)-dependent oxidoreductase [Cupriavidus sp. D384]|uniref:SDR family NAD(P)-dependent oxidoreductase n=1 Tax=Cupriavidus sp. D384 TaxID=1538095 RepID=UPI0008298F5E|nr:SDR family oxidoreductase [Cupriavidus sp. D384]
MSTTQTTQTTQKVAIITGASQGIGAELVKAYRQRGYRVVATARGIQQPDDANILAVPGDIASPDTARRVVSQAIEKFGRVDALVNNAGIFIAKPFTSYTAEDYLAKTGVNLAGFFYITQLAIAQMEKQGSGHVVSITTSLVDHAIQGVPSVLASLTKGGINAATKSLAVEYARRGIRVNAVSPGIIKSPMHAPETHEALGALHPMGHMGEMSDIAEAVLFLESAPFITGEILHVDGGQSAGH